MNDIPNACVYVSKMYLMYVKQRYNTFESIRFHMLNINTNICDQGKQVYQAIDR